MIELSVYFFLFVHLFIDAQLKFAEYLVLKEQIDENIIVIVVQPVFNFDDFQKFTVQFLDFVQ